MNEFQMDFFFQNEKREHRLKPHLVHFSTSSRKERMWAVHKIYSGIWPVWPCQQRMGERGKGNIKNVGNTEVGKLC